jgi:hypothetical protein
MEYVMPRNVTNGSTAGKGILYESVPIATSYSNKGIVGSGVLCWVRPETISRVPTGQVSRER